MANIGSRQVKGVTRLRRSLTSSSRTPPTGWPRTRHKAVPQEKDPPSLAELERAPGHSKDRIPPEGIYAFRRIRLFNARGSPKFYESERIPLLWNCLMSCLRPLYWVSQMCCKRPTEAHDAAYLAGADVRHRGYPPGSVRGGTLFRSRLISCLQHPFVVFVNEK